MTDEEIDVLNAIAAQPAEAAADGNSAKAHPLKDRIELKKLEAANRSTTSSGWVGMGKAIGVPPGAL